MAICAALINIYLVKFFYWETGYWASMDIAHDRAGYYICWGCLMWVPSIYASPALYLAGHPRDLSPLHAAILFFGGLAAIYINYDADRQRQTFRATNGRAKVWGRAPVKLVAPYTTASGARKQSLLLASGWWGVARHFHYLPEITAAFCWSAPAGFAAPLPYFYVAFLTALLVDRAFRDDARCAAKYGAVWAEYRALVPYKIVPGVF
jgi:7-dehydrocholesterol reductase